ncbi:MAG: response regulator [Pseudomonadota bacterium]|nr:response regulator [Pseudomonadota bacterium]
MTARMTHTGARVMIVEDEPELAALVADYARAGGFDAQVFGDGAQALAAALARPPDVLVLDLMLPGLDGLSVCRALRAAPASATLPIIMVTAKVEEIDRLLGLDSGADDYLCKPFSPRELVARIKALLRRSGGFAQVPVLNIDAAGQRVFIHGQPLDLTPTEFALLAGMARHPGMVFSRARLLDLVAQDKLDTSDRAIDSHIKNLRRKLGAVLPDTEPITALYGLGYRLDI